MADEIVNIAEEPANEGVEPQVAVVERAPLRIPTTLKSLIEALVFAAKEPLTIKQLQALYESQGNDGEERRIEPAEVSGIIQELNLEYESAGKPYRIIPLAGGFQFATQPSYAEWLGKLYKEQSRRKLSQSSIESLSIIAYKQPISKPEIESIRGVNCDYVLKTLLEKELVTIVGRAPTPGRPLLYGTTREFLKHFGLNDVSDLPRPREIEEILGESQFEAERRMMEAQQGLAEDPKKEEEDFKSRLPHIPKRKASLDETVRIVSKKKSRELRIRTEDEVQEPIPVDQVPVPEIPPGEGAASVVDEIVSGTNDEVVDEAAGIVGMLDSGNDVSGRETEEIEETGSIVSIPVIVQPASVEAGQKPPEPGVSELSADDRENEPENGVPSEAIRQAKGDSVISISAEPGQHVAETTHDEGKPETPGEEDMEVVEEKQSAVVEMPSTPEMLHEETARLGELSATDLDTSEAISDRVQTPEEDVLLEESRTVTPVEPEPSPAPLPDQQSKVPDEVPATDQASPVQGSSFDIPHEDLPEPPTVASAQTPAARPQAPHPKTPWQTWKEKIQGFIKKLFG